MKIFVLLGGVELTENQERALRKKYPDCQFQTATPEDTDELLTICDGFGSPRVSIFDEPALSVVVLLQSTTLDKEVLRLITETMKQGFDHAAFDPGSVELKFLLPDGTFGQFLGNSSKRAA